MSIDLDTAKAFLRVDGDDFDDQITRMISAATGYLESIDVAVTDDDGETPDAVEQAILMLVSYFFDNPQALADKRYDSIAFTVDRLIAPYREQSL